MKNWIPNNATIGSTGILTSGSGSSGGGGGNGLIRSVRLNHNNDYVITGNMIHHSISFIDYDY